MTLVDNLNIEEDNCADIVISGLIFDENGCAKNGALAIKDGCYMAVGECEEISGYIGLNTIMCGYRNKSVLSGVYTAATGVLVQEIGSRYRSDGNCQIVSEGLMTIKVGDPANLVVYDEQMQVFSENALKNARVLMRIVDGKIIYRKKERVKKAAFMC